MNLMHARIVPGEPTRFEVSSNRWGCNLCEARFLKIENSFMDSGMPCPKCKQGVVEERWHLVDISSFDGCGQCDCEWHQCSIAPKLRKMEKSARIFRPIRCQHVSFARTFILDVLLKLHIMEGNVKGQDEE